MKKIYCDGCSKEFNMGLMFSVVGKRLCKSCSNEEINLQAQAGNDIPQEEIVYLTDPTVCESCHSNSERPLPQMAGIHICKDCDTLFRNRPFPTWLKISFVGLLLLLFFSFYYNYSYFAGYIAMSKGEKAGEAGDFKEAARFTETAAIHVPGSKQVVAAANLYKGLDMYSRTKYRQAVPLLKQYEALVPDDYEAKCLRLRAEAYVAFDRSQYQLYYEKSKMQMEYKPWDALVTAHVSAALACRYAVTGNAEFKAKALDYLETARKRPKDQGEKDMLNIYDALIRHRLDTRKIITTKQFIKRFPDGWNPVEEKP
ncbi:MAG: hypothetical protein GY765_05640 [bacterium]|nr:hypothetical protein [bacterium]